MSSPIERSLEDLRPPNGRRTPKTLSALELSHKFEEIGGIMLREGVAQNIGRMIVPYDSLFTIYKLGRRTRPKETSPVSYVAINSETIGDNPFPRLHDISFPTPSTQKEGVVAQFASYEVGQTAGDITRTLFIVKSSVRQGSELLTPYIEAVEKAFDPSLQQQNS